VYCFMDGIEIGEIDWTRSMHGIDEISYSYISIAESEEEGR
jgi:hypothetical protein